VRARSEIVRSNLGDQVYDTLCERILDLEYEPSERLVIDQLARELGVSGTPVRDALNRLATERLIEFTPFRGFSVLPDPTPQEIERSFEARLAIEPFAARLGCERATEDDVGELRAIQDRIASHSYGKRSGSFARFVRLNREFHDVLVGTSGNPFLVAALRSLYHEALTARTMHGRGVPDLEHVNDEHRAIIDALERRDPDAAEAAVSRHVRDGAARILAARAGATV
jgi:DNA-binding GntR family transcriptional regulator